MTETTEYRVQLEQFEGPLDLLLFLIRRAEVEITDIPIATIANQFITYLRASGVDHIDIDRAGEFLVMAATLMEIKSRMLMPPEQTGRGPNVQTDRDHDSQDPRAALVEQLLAYKKYRDAAERLNAIRHEWEARYPNAPAPVDRASYSEAQAEMREYEEEDLHLSDLLEAFSRIVEAVNFERVGEHTITLDDTPIELHQADIVDFISREAGNEGTLPFTRLFTGRKRAEMIGLFLALLELVRQQRIMVVQEQQAQGVDTEIVVRLGEVQETS